MLVKLQYEVAGYSIDGYFRDDMVLLPMGMTDHQIVRFSRTTLILLEMHMVMAMYQELRLLGILRGCIGMALH